MGASVSPSRRRAGIEVLIDRDQKRPDKGKGLHAQSVIDDLINKKGRAKESDREAIMGRISATADYNVLKDCDPVIEGPCSRTEKGRRRPMPAASLLEGMVRSSPPTLPRLINLPGGKTGDQGKFIGIYFSRRSRR
jgi:3-hydroxyacyl-CoA dehydrogenase/enoyl-CoA hydratase/3-hydroxybutyryl-CoA epimerase